jgi:DegV family protein with EDD domain
VRGSAVLIADSCCDLPLELLQRRGIEGLSFPYVIGDEPMLDDFQASMSHVEFYRRMRDGASPTTAQIPLSAYISAFRAHAEREEDVLHFTLSSRLSGTFETAIIARRAVLDEFPQARIEVIDSLSASVADGGLILALADRLDAGDTADEVLEWFRVHRPRLNGHFTVDSLEHLRRGGRISDVAAAAGTLLDIKPLLYLDQTGRLEVGAKVRGRRKSIRAIAEIVAANIENAASQTIIIGHGDAVEDAALLREAIAERVEPAGFLDTEIGPVIGSHTGPGMVAAVFWGRPV